MSASKKGTLLKEWASDVKQNMATFHEASEIAVYQHQKCSLKSREFAETLRKMATNEICAPVKTAITTLAQTTDDVEIQREKLLGQYQAYLVEQFDKYPSRVKVQQHNIDTRNKEFKKVAEKQARVNKMRSGGTKTLAKAEEAKQMLDAELKRMSAAEETLNGSVAEFERERLNDVKTLLLRYIKGQIHFYARTLEGLTASYAAVAKIDPDAEVKRLIERLQKLEMEDVGKTPN